MSSRKRDRASSDADPYRSREQAKYESPIASREFITSVLKEETGPIDFEALAERLALTDDPNALEALRRRVGAMLRDGQLIQNRRRGLVPVDAAALIAGRVSAHPDGFGFLITDDDDKDVYLNGKQMRQVLHGDRVVVCITGVDRRGRREGRIVEVVERANRTLVGRVSIDRGTVVVMPDNKRIHQDLLIAPGELSTARDGDMVVAEIIEQPSRRHQPVGKVIEVLGQSLRPGMEIEVALHGHGIPSEWPQAVLDQAAGFAASVDPKAAKGRKDVRDVPLITIDGADARDFDDAVWCERVANGWRLFVAIADVAHYVEPDSPLDVEAVDRGTSVYFPGRVVPMLPEALSNGLCSLNPEVDRLCMLCEMNVDDSGEVGKTRFHNAIMRSHARLTYDQVHEMLSQRSSPLRDKHASLLPMIEQLHDLYQVLAQQRRQRGAIEFDSNETMILFDENKKIRQIVPVQRNDAHKLIEECMILANIQAAAFLEEREMPALYRVHSGPKADRLEDLRAFLALRGLSLAGGSTPTALDYAALAEAISDLPDRSVIQTMMLRSMQQAVYQPENEGHFGLALDQYAHFTSPIRRYPDLLVHRAIKHVLARRKAKTYRYTKQAMQALGESCSMTERRAEEASRDVVSWLKCEYMQDHVGSEFDGVISAVTSFGLFVELTDIHVEGLIHITNLSRDYYRFDQAAQALTGERTGRQYRLGDPLRVRVAAVNLEERKIDFQEVEGRVGRARSTVTQLASRAPATAGTQQPKKVKSAEQRRQEKRRRKQEKRDRKRAAQRKERELEKAAAREASELLGMEEVVPNGPVSALPSSASDVGTGTDAKAGSITTAHEAPDTGPAAAATSSTEQPATGKRSAKKVGERKVAEKKTASKKVAAKKVAAKKVAAKKAVSKKTSASKAVAGKRAAKKAVSGKTVAKKTASSKAVAEKAATGKVAAKKTVAKKATTKKAVARKSATGKAAAKKTVTKRATAGKAAGKKVVARTAVAKKVAAGKVVAKKAASVRSAAADADVTGRPASTGAGKKAAARKVGSRGAASGKVVSKRGVSKKTVARRAAVSSAVSKKVTTRGASKKKAVGGKSAATRETTKKSASGKKTVARRVTRKQAGSPDETS